MLSVVRAWVIQEQQLEIEAAPTGEEVMKIMNKLPKSKAPGIDGMIMEVLLACWRFIQINCLNMILQF